MGGTITTLQYYMHTVVLTCGPTTPEGPGGPVFPWNP